MMRDAAGEAGLRKEEIDALAPQCLEVHQGLHDLRRLGQLPFRDLPFHEEMVAGVQEKARWAGDNFQTVLLLGIGGSALGPAFLAESLGQEKSSSLIVCDHVDAREWLRIASASDWKRTLLTVISKSGATVETWAAFSFFQSYLKQALGEGWRKSVLILTDPKEGGLRKVAESEKIASLDIPSGVGGRYSILSAVGLFPAACQGIKIDELLAGARRMDERCKGGDPWFNPALMNAALHYLYDTCRGRKTRVTITYGEDLAKYAAWFAQLWAESLGKRHSLQGEERRLGTLPVCASGPRDQHSQLQLYLDGPEDKTVTFIAVEEGEKAILPNDPLLEMTVPGLGGRSVHELQSIERLATEEALREAGRPTETILLRRLDAYSIGQLLFLAELETVYAGGLYDVNPFDQPAVEMIKRNIQRHLSGKITPQKSRGYMI